MKDAVCVRARKWKTTLSYVPASLPVYISFCLPFIGLMFLLGNKYYRSDNLIRNSNETNTSMPLVDYLMSVTGNFMPSSNFFIIVMNFFLWISPVSGSLFGKFYLMQFISWSRAMHGRQTRYWTLYWLVSPDHIVNCISVAEH